MSYKRITDDEIFKAIADLDNKEEQAFDNAIKVLLLSIVDTRQLLRKMYKNSPKVSKVYKQPTGRKDDIIVGESNEL